MTKHSKKDIQRAIQAESNVWRQRGRYFEYKQKVATCKSHVTKVKNIVTRGEAKLKILMKHPPVRDVLSWAYKITSLANEISRARTDVSLAEKWLWQAEQTLGEIVAEGHIGDIDEIGKRLIERDAPRIIDQETLNAIDFGAGDD